MMLRQIFGFFCRPICAIVTSALVLFLLSLQGVDLADEGFWMSNARFALEKPESVQYAFSYWLTVVTTAIWGRWISDTALSYRWLGVLVRMMVVVMAACSLKAIVKPRSLGVGILWGVLLSTGSTLVLYGSSYTALFYMAAVTLLLKGSLAICEGSNRIRCGCLLLFIAGVILGSSVFVRIPNLTSALLVVIPVGCVVIMQGVDVRLMLMSVGLVGCGWSIGFAAMALLVFCVGHGAHFLAMLDLFREIASHGHHSVGLLILVQLKYYLWAVSLALVVVVMLCLGLVALRLIELKLKFAWNVYVVHLISAVGCLLLFVACIRYWMARLAILIPAGSFLLAFVYVLFRGGNRVRKCYWLGAFILLGVQPLGSDVPFEANKFVLPFVMPLFVDIFMSTEGLLRQNVARILGAMNVRALFSWAFGALFVSMAVYAYQGVTRDCSNRLRLTESIPLPQYKGLFTTPERKNAVMEIVDNVGQLLKDEESFVVFPCLPGLHALLNKPSALEGTWSSLFPPEVMKDQFELAMVRNGKLPIVVLQKTNTCMYDWPLRRTPFWRNGESMSKVHQAMHEILSDFRYNIVWENEDVAVYKPVEGGMNIDEKGSE